MLFLVLPCGLWMGDRACPIEMEKILNKKSGPVFAILSAILFGTMPLFTKIAYAGGCNSYTVAFGRFLTGALAAGIVIAAVPGLSLRISGSEFKKIVLLSLFYAVTPVLLYESYQTISTGLATTLHFTYPVAVMVLTAVLFREKLSRRKLLCLCICAAGIAGFYRPGAQEGSLGMFLAVLSGFTYAIYILLLGKSGIKRLHVMTITFWISALASAEIGIFAAFSHKLSLPAAWEPWAAMGGLGVFATVMALAFFQLGVFYCGEVKASLLSTFEPLTSVLIGIVVFHEAMTLRILAGMILILLSTLLLVTEKQA